MGPDTGDIIPKGEIPTESEFARLMCDKTFVDYLNVFLSLPVFSQRLLYRFSDQSFELDPPLKRTQYRLDRVKLMRWVRTKRAPFFFKSDLYLEYLFCKQLQKTQLHLVINYGADSIGARDKMMDHCLMTRWLRQMSGMRRFRCFIAKTAGNNLVQFWLDAEKFRRKAADYDADKWTIMYQRMEAKFFKNQNLKLPDFEKMKRVRNQCNAESPLASEGNVGTGIRSTRGMSGFEAFIVVQGFILKTLQNYWLPRYLVHCKQVFTKFNQTTLTIYRPDCYSVKVRSLSEIVNGDADAANDDGKERRGSDVRSHHTIRKAQLKKQSVSNLMSMFSSSKVRRSELTTLLQVEDTGETVSAGLAEDDQIRQSTTEENDELKVKGQDWLSEEFPLPAISEESASYRGSRSVSPAKSVVRDATSAALSPASSPEMPTCGDNEGSRHDLEKKTSRRSQHSSRKSTPRRCSTPLLDVAPEDEGLKSPARTSSSSPLNKPDDSQRTSPEAASTRKATSGRRSRRSSSRKGSSKGEPSARASAHSTYQPPEKEEEEGMENAGSDEEESDDSSTDISREDLSEGKKKSKPRSVKGTAPPIIQNKENETSVDIAVTSAESEEMSSGKNDDSSSTSEKTCTKDDIKHKGNIADLTKFRRNSESSRSSSQNSSSTSVGQSSTSSLSLASLSSRRMSAPVVPAGPRPLAVSKPSARRRSRSQSVEFRLGDLSLFLNKNQDADNSKNEKSKSSSNEKMQSSKLEADLLALQALQQDREKRKKERMKQRRLQKKAKQKQKKDTTANEVAGKDFVGLNNGEETKALVSTLKKLAMRRKGTVCPLSKINRAAFQKLEVLHTFSLHEAEKQHRQGQTKYLKRLVLAQRQLQRTYSELSFDEKLREDDRRLIEVSSLPDARDLVEDGAVHLNDIIPQKTKMLPSITEQKPFSIEIVIPCLKSYNLGEANYRVKNKLLINAMLSDKLAGGPWTKFLARYGYSNELRYMRFFHAAQEYLTADLQFSDSRRCQWRQRLAADIINNFLKSTAELIHQLPANLGDELLVHAQNLSCEALREVWDVFKRQDLDSFLNRTSQRKNSQQRVFPLYTSPTSNQASGHTLTPTPPDAPASPLGPKMERTLSSVLIEARKGGASPSDTDGGGKMPIASEQDGAMSQSAAPYRLLRAVELGLCASGLGCADAVLSDLSDPEDESDDEGSLRRKHMVILRKRKIKTTPKPVINRRRPQDIPRTTQHSRAKRSSHGSDTPQSNERDQETTKQGVCRAIRKGGKTIHRPSRPRNFVEVLHDASHFEFFRRYLQVEVGNELPLSFWQSVEQLRMGNVRDPKVRQAKAAAIVKKYFNKSTNYGTDLMTDADIIQDIPHMEKVTPQMLMSAQTCVAKSMEDKFFEDYRESYADDATEDTINEEPAQVHFGQGRTKYLWNMFITNVCQFRRGLMTPWLLSLFKDFLGREIQREVEKQRATGVVSKRIIGGKIVMVDKLQNDLCFWAEVERFKQLADNAARAAAAGTYTLEDEEYVQKKANAIIDVFLDSFVPPRVQINVPQEIAEDIIDIAQHGIIERGLFHDAAIHTFTVLLYCWKKFTREQFGPPRISQPPKKKPMKKRRASTPRVCGVKIKTIIGASSDDAPRMFYTIETGVQLILPPKPKPDIIEVKDRDRDRYRNIMRSLINSGHEESLLQLFQTQPAALGLGLAQQRRLSRSLGLPLPSQPTF
ncbi:uncharacterized protein [Diadema antillarum]|uniref:uncharacterized protein n=1 Tax=Diadema antillarum TaxID=105358 RepID=UPI003A89E8A4